MNEDEHLFGNNIRRAIANLKGIKSMAHRCECKHEQIKYCEKCKKPFCVDCKLEWHEAQPRWNYISPAYSQINQHLMQSGSYVAQDSKESVLAACEAH